MLVGVYGLFEGEAELIDPEDVMPGRIEAQILRDGDLSIADRFDLRELAARWADDRPHERASSEVSLWVLMRRS